MYELIYDMNNLYDAWTKVKKVSSWKERTQRFDEDLIFHLSRIQDGLKNKTLLIGHSTQFKIYERGKTRIINSYDLDTRIAVRSFIDNILLPKVQQKLIYDNSASVKGKGVDFHRRRLIANLQKYYRMNGNNGYILLIDFRKFFDNIDHILLKSIFSDILQDRECSEFAEKLIDSYKVDVSNLSDDEIAKLNYEPFDNVKYFNEHRSKKKKGEKFLSRGVSIGGQLSQIAGIVYPYKLDNFIKIVCGEKYYARYMDDLYIIGKTKEHLKELLVKIQEKCREYHIFINPKKTHIVPINRFFTILQIQYMVKDNGDIIRKPCKDSFTRERRAIKKFKQRIREGIITKADADLSYKSWRGNVSKFDCKKSVLRMDEIYKESIGEMV